MLDVKNYPYTLQYFHSESVNIHPSVDHLKTPDLCSILLYTLFWNYIDLMPSHNR